MTAAQPAPPILVPIEWTHQDERRPIATLIGADFSALSITPQRADHAPHVVRAALERFKSWDAVHKVELAGRSVHDLGDIGACRMEPDAAFGAIRAGSMHAHGQDRFVIALGGDHSVTWPLVLGLKDHRPDSRIGIIQLDVHHDVRELDRGPSNGTPIRGLVETNVVRPDDIVQIGIHPFANRREHSAWCDERHVKRVPLSEVRSRGGRAVVTSAHAALSSCDLVYLTVDIDVLDRSFAPGTVAALPGGLDPMMLFELVDAAISHPRVVAMDVVEFDPTRDISDTTAYNVAMVVMTAVSALTRRGTQAGGTKR